MNSKNSIHRASINLCVVAMICAAAEAAPQLDQYGGLLSLPSPNPATGNWRLEKINNQWWFITPQNNAFHYVAVYNVGTGDGNVSPAGTYMRDIIYSKYNTDSSKWPCKY